MAKSLLPEHDFSKALSRFNQLYEYTFITRPLLDEADDDDDPQQDQTPQNGQMGGGNQPMGGGNRQMLPQGQGMDMGQMGDPQGQPMDNQQGQAPMQGQGDEQGMTDPMMGDPQGGGFDDVDMEGGMDTEPMQDGDEVIDVDALTSAQEALAQTQDETMARMDGVDQKISQVLDIVGKYITAIEDNSSKLEALNNEFQKRNPTETEKLNIRSQAAAPYNQYPRDYWDNKVQNDPHYDVMFDNGVPTNEEQREFAIRQSDVDNYSEGEINKSFDKSYKLSDFLNF